MRKQHGKAGTALGLALSLMALGACDGVDEGIDDGIVPVADAIDASRSLDGVPIERGPERARSGYFVVDSLAFPVEESGGIAPGFNLDGDISEESQPASCGHYDFTSASGVKGVDNQLAVLTPLFELVGLGAVTSLLQEAIDEGGLLIIWRLEDVDSWTDDADITLTMMRGVGTPLLGTDGRLLPSQTFTRATDFNEVSVAARIDDGVLTTEPFTTVLPIVVFGVFYELDFVDALFEGRIEADGSLSSGVFGGAVPMSSIMDLAVKASEDDGSVLGSIEAIVPGLGDLEPDGDGLCLSLSAAVTLTAKSAFLYAD